MSKRANRWLGLSLQERWSGLREAVSRFQPLTDVEPARKWQGLSEDEIWRALVGQVVVVGNSSPWGKLKEQWEGLGIDYVSLVGLERRYGDSKVAEQVQNAFAKLGVRYVGKNARPSPKALAVARNLKVLAKRGGPVAFMRNLAAIESERERCNAVRKALAYLGHKGARDFLLGMGAARNVIALDARVLGVLQQAGILIEMPSLSRGNYEAIEDAIISNVAVPLRIEGAVVDRALYQHAAEIRAELGGSGSTPRSFAPRLLTGIGKPGTEGAIDIEGEENSNWLALTRKN